jgi:hypothetical protein
MAEMGPQEEKAFAAGYTEAVKDHAADIERLAAQDADIRALQLSLATARQDLDRLRRTAAALEEEAADYFEQLRKAGAFDAELVERKIAYRARQKKKLQCMNERLHAERPDYPGGPVQWPEP